MTNETNRLKIFDSKIVFDGQFIRVIARSFLNKVSGKTEVWESVQRKKSFGRIVAVLPVTPDGKLILIKIFRMALQNWTIEPIAGLMDVGVEEEISLAKREMCEESGYKAEKIELLCSGPFNSGLLDSEIAFYVALNAKKISTPVLEDVEDIEVLEIPLNVVTYFLANKVKSGISVDVKLYGLISLLKEKYKWHF